MPGPLVLLFPPTMPALWSWKAGEAVLKRCFTLSSVPVAPFSCLPRPSPTTSNLQTTTKEKSPTGSPSPACPSLWDLLLSLHAPPSHSSANKCLLKVAGYAAQLEQYQKAIDIYEQVGFTWLSASATHLCLPHSVPTLSQATLTKCFFHLQPVLGVSCPSSWALSPELGILCRKSKAGGRRISRGGTLNHGKQQVSCDTVLGVGLAVAVGERQALLLMLPQLPPLCPLNASFLCVWQWCLLPHQLGERPTDTWLPLLHPYLSHVLVTLATLRNLAELSLFTVILRSPDLTVGYDLHP